MARVDFYIMSENETAQRDVIVCRLVQKAFLQGLTAFVQTNDTEQSTRIDDLMWTFQANSFIPHTKEPVDFDADWPVAIHHTAPKKKFDVLVNLQDAVPEHSKNFAR